eukprot:TRINITY_DN2144_c0_g1_i1.p1 TRINITY_DN2144_c0_g1~~TRINITY_DN2144_c0_g1_i1.p1  ORF type:complete len:623 (+),score=103.27 TRINITY_DN2144_c0_g1_i1:409-2277(+)
MLEHVYGYKVGSSSMNCYYTSEGKAVYHCAAVGIVLDTKKNTQVFFGGVGLSQNSGRLVTQHNSKITCLAISSDRRLVATGQTGRYPSVFIWDPSTCLLKKATSVIRLGEKNYFPGEIAAISFSHDLMHVAIADNSEEHKVYVFTVDDHRELFSSPSKTGSIKGIAWVASKQTLCTVGKKAVKLWYPFDKHKSPLICTIPSLSMTTDFLCVTFDNAEKCYTGGANGYIYVWDSEGNAKEQIQAQQGAIYALRHVDDKSWLIVGGAGGKVAVYRVPEFKVESEYKFGGVVVAVDYLEKPERLLVGLLNGKIIEVQIDQDNYYNILMESHGDGHVTALDVIEDNVVTAGEDNKVIVWNTIDRRCFVTSTINENGEKKRVTGNQSRFPDNQRCRLLAINKVTGHVALAINNGTLQIRQSCYMIDTKIHSINVLTHGLITALKYTTAGDKLAAAANDMHIRLYDCTDNYKNVSTITVPESYLIELDWSVDGGCIRGMCTNSLVHFFDPIEGRVVRGDIDWTRKLEWATSNVKLTWETVGVFPKGCDGEHIKAVNVSAKKGLVAAGDVRNMVNLYRNPCRPGGKCKSLRAHAATIERIVFSSNDERIFTVAGSDRCLMQWKLNCAHI